MDNHESKQLQGLANDLYIIHEKIIKTDALIKIVKEKSKRCNKLEKLHKKLLDTHNQLQLKQTESESKLNNCIVNHTPLEIEIKDLRTRFANAEELHSNYVNAAELKYQNVCQELTNLKYSQVDCLPKIKEKRNKKHRYLTKEDLFSKIDDLTIQLELTKSELESLNKDKIEKEKIINKYEYEKQVLNEKIESLNNKLTKHGIQKSKTENFNVNEICLTNHSIENDFVISELDNTLPILSDSICADIVNLNEKEFTSSYMQTDDLFFFRKKKQTFKSFGVQVDLVTKAKSFSSFGCQTNFKTNSVKLQTEDVSWREHLQNLRRETLKTSSSQTYYDDIINFEDILIEMTSSNPIVSPLSPTPPEDKHTLNENKTRTVAVGSDETIPIFIDNYCQVDSYTQTEINKIASESIAVNESNENRNKNVDSYTQTVSELLITVNKSFENNINVDHIDRNMIDFNCQTDQIKLIETDTQTESNKKVDSTSQTDHHINESINLKPLSNKLLSPNIKTSQRFWETKLKNRLNTPNSKISKKYKTTKNKLLEHLKLSHLDFKKILEKYLSEGNGPTLFVSPKILKSSQMNIYNSCKHQNPFININNRPLFKQCNSKPINLHECPCFHSCNMQQNYPSCTTLQCNISCNGYAGYCNHSHRIKIKHNAKAVIVSDSESESEQYDMRNYYRNKFRNKYKAKRNCKCNQISNKNFYNKLNTLKREAKSSDTDASNKPKKRMKRLNASSSDSDDSASENNTLHIFRNPISRNAQKNIINNSSVTKPTPSENPINNELDLDKNKLKNPVPNICEDKTQKRINSSRAEKIIENEEMPIINDNISLIDNNCDNRMNINSNSVNVRSEDKNTKISPKNKMTEKVPDKSLSLNKNIAKPKREKTTKIQRLRNLLNKTPLNYNKSNILTRSMSKNVQLNSNNKHTGSSKSANKELDLFGSLSDSSFNSDLDENLNKSPNKTELNNRNTSNRRSRNKCNSQKQINNDIPNKENNTKKSPLNTTPEKNQFRNSVKPSLKVSRNLEYLETPKNYVYKRPGGSQKISTGPLSPESVSCDFVKPKVIPLEQISSTSNSNNLEKISEDKLQVKKNPKVIADIIYPSIFDSTAAEKNIATCSSKQIKPVDTRFIAKMISDIATMDWNKDLMNTVVASLVSHDPLVIAKLIVNEAAVDHAQQLDKSFTPPAPIMTPGQQKLLVLINRLDNEGLNGFKKNVIILAEQRILSEKYLTNILGLTRIFVALCKLQYDIEGVRMFCCNAAYYLGDLLLPIMFIVLTMWGDVLPMASADVPLAVTLVQVIQSKTCSTPGYNSSTLKNLISDYYEYKKGEITNDQVMEKLIACFIENPCSSIFTSILILCKNLPSKWRFSQMKKHLMPLVDQHKLDQSKSKLISITLNLVNRLKVMFNAATDQEYIQQLNTWLLNSISNTNSNKILTNI